MTQKMTHWFYPASVAAMAVIMPWCGAKGATGSATARPEGRPGPNILFIMTDQQHAGMLSGAGNRYLRTPALDALAAAGTRFERAYAANPVCVPSRFSLQTGRMPSAIGMRTNEVQLKVPADMCVQSLGPVLRRACRT